MLRSVYISLLILSVAISEGVSDSKKVELSLSEYESDFKFAMAMGEDQSWKIDVGYHDEEFDESEQMRKREGNINSKMEKNNIFFSGSYSLNFQNGATLSFGGDYEHFTNKMEEWGFYDETIKGSTQRLTMKNKIEIEGNRFSISVGAGYKHRYFDTDILLRVTPKEKFDMTQNTQVFPILTEGGELDSTATLDTSYKIRGELFTSDNLLGDFKIGVDASYQKIPFSYRVKRIKNSDYSEFITKDIEYDEETTKYNLIGVMKFNEKTHFKIEIGEIKNEQIRPNETITLKERTITAGIEIWF